MVDNIQVQMEQGAQKIILPPHHFKLDTKPKMLLKNNEETFPDNQYFDKDDEEAEICSQSTHACCKEFLKNDPSIVNKLLAAAENNDQNKAEKPEGVSFATGKFISKMTFQKFTLNYPF